MKVDRRTFMSACGGTLIAWGLDPAAVYSELPDNIFTVIPHNPSDADKARLLADLMNYLMNAHFNNFMLAIQDTMIYNPLPVDWKSEIP